MECCKDSKNRKRNSVIKHLLIYYLSLDGFVYNSYVCISYKTKQTHVVRQVLQAAIQLFDVISLRQSPLHPFVRRFGLEYKRGYLQTLLFVL